ncbi:MAG: aminoacyl-tRNA hydrolase [Planctomycetota bacterium]
MLVVVGLGNPGKKYENTRHNVGFDALTVLAKRLDAAPLRAKFSSLVAECRLGQHRALLVWPQTFMNSSGLAARQVSAFYKTPPDQMLVVCDDFNLPLGQLRIRGKGSAGGQNGLKDILQKLGSTDVPRLRLGIGPLPEGRDVTGFVLGGFAKPEQEHAAAMTVAAADAIECWAGEGMTAAMNRHN